MSDLSQTAPDELIEAEGETYEKVIESWKSFMTDNRKMVLRLSAETKLTPGEVIAFMQLKTLSAILMRVDTLSAIKQAELMSRRKTDSIVLAH